MVEPAQGNPLEGRTLYIPRMCAGSAELFAGAFRAIGVEARPTPPGDAHTRELAARHLTGDECYPQMITLGDILKIAQEPGFDPKSAALFMPTASGPCRFGQYAPLIRRSLGKLGLGDLIVFSPSCDDGYRELGDGASSLYRLGWWALVGGDLFRKLLHRVRPYEKTPGATDALYAEAISTCAEVLARRDAEGEKKLKTYAKAVGSFRDRFRAIEADFSKPRPLIGVCGEIFCRLNTFSNDDLIRRIEAHGGEASVADIAEWIYYTNFWEREMLRFSDRTLSPQMAVSLLSEQVQKRDERTILKPFKDDLAGIEGHSVSDIVKKGGRYIPPHAALGEMILNLGNAVQLHASGADAMVDVSPFSCMNGIVSEALYPKVSRDLDGMPIRVFYFDGTGGNLDEDVSILMELAKNYGKRKKARRNVPPWFGSV